MRSKNLKICVVKNYGYSEKLYDDSYDFEYFKKNFISTFNTEKQGLVKDNLAEIEDIYINNYACFTGFFESMFYDFFHDEKHYQKARNMLMNSKNIKKDFWKLDIL